MVHDGYKPTKQYFLFMLILRVCSLWMDNHIEVNDKILKILWSLSL